MYRLISWLASLLIFGQATFYSPGIMREVAINRGLECAECIGYAALMDCEHLGEQVWILANDEWAGPLLVVDCAAPQHVDSLRERRWVVDLDWYTWHKTLNWPDKPMSALVLIVEDTPRGFME